jgi:hypothetical protein
MQDFIFMAARFGGSEARLQQNLKSFLLSTSSSSYLESFMTDKPKPMPSPSPGKQLNLKRAPEAPTAPKAEQAKDLRATRTADYRREALARPDFLSAMAGVSSADLFEMAQPLKELIVDALRNGVTSFADYHQLDPAIKRHIEMLRQIERMVQLELKLSPPPPATTKSTPPPSAANDITKRKTA